LEIKSKHILCSIPFFENREVYDRMWKDIIEQNRQQMTIWRMRIARWIPTATNTHSEYVILINFPLQKWLHKRASLLRYTYTACLVKSRVVSSLSHLVVVCVHYYKQRRNIPYSKSPAAITSHNNRPTYTYRLFTFHFCTEIWNKEIILIFSKNSDVRKAFNNFRELRRSAGTVRRAKCGGCEGLDMQNAD